MGTHAEHERTIQTLDLLCQRYPKAFSYQRSEIRPLKPGIIDDLVADLGSEEFRRPVKRALAYYQSRLHYLSKVVSGKNYRDMHGNRCGLVDPETKVCAQHKLDCINAQRGV